MIKLYFENFYSLKSVFVVCCVLILGCNSNTEINVPKDTVSKPIVEAPVKISLAQWSLHKSFLGGSNQREWSWYSKMLKESPDSILMGELDPFDFPEIAKGYGVDAIELVSTFYLGKANDWEYWKAFKEKCDEAGVSVNLIMCDILVELAHKDSLTRENASKAHRIWVDIAQYLDAHSLRVNLNGSGEKDEKAQNSILGLKSLAKYAATHNINILVENHGGYSSNGFWLSEVIKAVNMDNVGTLPDFGNFCLEYGLDGCKEEYDRYKGLKELMPYAKAVSAKSNIFDKNGDEINIDYNRVLRIVKDANYSGFIGVEYEGEELSEDQGIKKTIQLLKKNI